jgi:hypothetical protein
VEDDGSETSKEQKAYPFAFSFLFRMFGFGVMFGDLLIVRYQAIYLRI